MKSESKIKKKVIEWIFILAIPSVIYFTGLHTEAVGRMQQVLLWAGLMQADTNLPEKAQKAADYDLTLVSFSGEIINLSQFRGKTIFLNFWASWCPPCIAELPSIHSLYKKVNKNDVVFLLVSLDNNYSKARQFILNKGFSFPVFIPLGDFPRAYRVSSVPTTFVISPNGKIVAMKEGMADYDTENFRNFLVNLSGQRLALNESSDIPAGYK